MTETVEHDRASLQERYAPENHCFGCGPANERGLGIRSFPVGDGDGIVATWQPEPHHEAFDGVVNGGILGTLLDCHSNWAAAWHLMRRDSLETPPFTVTADFHVKLKRPTPSDTPLEVRARAVSSQGSKVSVEASITARDEVTATCTGTFVAVGPDHPAYRRW